MGNLLDTPNTTKKNEIHNSSTGLCVGSSCMQGFRFEMEDDHILADMPSKSDHTLLAVFDGHGGAGAAIFAAQRLIGIIENTREWKNYVSGGARDYNLLGVAMQQAFLDIDVAIREKQTSDNSGDGSGCTAVTAMITPSYIVCANAGDSRCVLATNNGTKAMSEDHKPYDEPERRRIEAAGGRVQWRRVDGDLAVSRAFGDFQYKMRDDLGPKEQKVSCFPDITIHQRTPEDEALILACDGVWDVISNDEACNIVREIFADGGTVLDLVAEELIDTALQKGSKDNLSAIIMRLPGAKIGVHVSTRSEKEKDSSNASNRIFRRLNGGSSKSDSDDLGPPRK